MAQTLEIYLEGEEEGEIHREQTYLMEGRRILQETSRNHRREALVTEESP
jgi:hypothetical protein